MSSESIIDQYREKVDARLVTLLPSEETLPTELHQAIRYSALGTGKRLRPAITMAAAKACGADPLLALDAGCATELVHCFSLIHDDLPAIDNDDLRRGQPTCHKAYGEAIAILAGDALFALAFEILAHSIADPAKAQKSLLCLARASGSQGLVGGEVLDIQAEGQSGDMALLQTIHARKTGALLGACCEIGAIIAGATAEHQANLKQFGEQIGLAFQVADDVLNETSTPEQLGKAVGSDYAMAKLTYPSLIGLDNSKNLASELVTEALKLIEGLPGDASELKGLAEYAVIRDW
ncbi:MAG: polyprenyl synthetase family protein [Fimbriimonadaceae bacterium]|nr:MAG: polyprenyl synthetase family protein [Fimbriimonadaceae bacterium]